MSNLTVGKIVNNSMTLVLNSTDQDGFGTNVFTGNNFTKLVTDVSPAGTYSVKTMPSVEHTGALVDKPYIETFHFMKNGKTTTNTTVGQVVTGNNFETDGLYVIKSMPTDVNGWRQGGVSGAGGVLLDLGANPSGGTGQSKDRQDAEVAELLANGNGKLVYKCSNNAEDAAFDGVAIYVGTVDPAFPDQHDLRVGETFILHEDVTSAFQSATFDGTAYALSAIDYNNLDYKISIPNEASFPGKSRCLVKVESISANDLTSFELPVYVDIPEMAPHNLFIKDRRAIGVVFGGIWNPASIRDCGVLCQTPFGKTLSVKLFDAVTRSLLGTNMVHTLGGVPNIVGKFPTSIVIRLLFLTNEDLKDF